MRVRRSRLRIVLFLVVIPLLVLFKILDVAVDEASNAHQFDIYRSSFAFAIDHERSCTFRLAERSPMIKIVTNASVDRAVPVHENESFEYVLSVQALDGSGEVIERREYTLRGRRTFAFDSDSGRLIQSHAYLGQDWVPTSSKVVMLPMQEFPHEVEQLRLRVLHMDPALRDVVVRVLEQDAPPDYKLYYLWHRMSRERKERVAQFNLYGPEALRTEEIHNLLKARLASVAPQGIEGRDFERRRIYVYDESPARSHLSRVEPHGRIAAPGRHAVIPVPRQGDLLLWRFRPADSGEHFTSGDHVELHSVDAETGARKVERVALGGPESRFVEDPGRGTVELRASVELAANLYVFFEEEWIEVTTELKWVPTYLTQWGLPILYDISGGVPVRIDVRRLLTPGESVGTYDVSFPSFTATGADGEVLAHGDLEHRESTSEHDEPIGNYRECAVTESSRHFIRLPHGTRSLTIESFGERMAVSVYTRPTDMLRRVQVPDDYDDFAREHDGIEPRPEPRNWYPLHPRQVGRWIEENRRVVIGVQRKPKEVVRSDRSFTTIPARESVLLPLLAPSDAGQSGSTHGLFTELPSATADGLTFHGSEKMLRPQVRVLCVQQGEGIGTLRIQVDGKLSEQWFRGPFMELVGASLIPGAHDIELFGPPGVRMFVNGASATARPTFRRKFVQILDRELTHVVTKADRRREVLSVHVWVAADEARNSDEGLRIAADLEFRSIPGVAAEHWTYRHSEFEISFDPAGPSGLLLSKGHEAVLERVLFLVLGADVVPGEVIVRLRKVTGPSCLVQVLRSRDTRQNSRAVFSTDRAEGRD